MNHLIATLIAVVTLDIIVTCISYRRLKKKLLTTGPTYQINNVKVEEFYWANVLTSITLRSLDEKEKQDYIKYMLYKGAEEIVVKLLEQDLIEKTICKLDDGSEIIKLKLRAVQWDRKS